MIASRTVTLVLLAFLGIAALNGVSPSGSGPARSAQRGSPWTDMNFCTERVSVSTGGMSGNAESSSVSLSDDGQLVAFCSNATNLVPDDTNAKYDNFIRDRLRLTTTRVTFAYEGTTGSAGDDDIFLSGDGTTIAYITRATRDRPGGALLCADGDPVPHRECIVVRDLATGAATVVDARADGRRGNGFSRWPALSRDGSLVAFWSTSTDLVPDDLNRLADVFVRNDAPLGGLARVSIGPGGVEGNGRSGDIGQIGADAVAISRDGCVVVFPSNAGNLVAGSNYGVTDVLVRDRCSDVTELISMAADGGAANARSALGARQAVSDDGRFVVFSSDASNLVPGDTNSLGDVFVRDRLHGTTALVSVDSSGMEANGRSGPLAAISADGRYVAFNSYASNLIPNDTNGWNDIFVRDLVVGVTVRASVSTAGLEANGENGDQIWRGLSISADGLAVAWSSAASNLVPDDTNLVRDVFVRAPCPWQPTLDPVRSTTPTATPAPTETISPTATRTQTATLTRTASPTMTSTAWPTPTASASLTASPTSSSTPTPIVRCICNTARRSAPAAVLHDAVANPEHYYGWLMPLNPNKQPSPANPLRECLSLQNANLEYHPLHNAPVWKVGCP